MPIKIVVLYQVIMHYRLPFYERMQSDPDLDFTLLYGKGQPGTKLVNADISNKNIKALQIFTLRIPFSLQGGIKLPFSPFLFFTLIRLSPSVVFSEGSSSLINSTQAFLYAKIFRKKFIWWSLGKLEGKEYSGVRKVINKWEKIIERGADAIFTYSSQGAKYFSFRGVKEERIFVGVNVLDTKRKLEEIDKWSGVATNKLSSIDQSFKICFIGTLASSKNIELLIDAVELLRKNERDVQLHVVGDGPHARMLNDYVNNKGLTSFVIFHGRINEGASVVLGQCDIMVLPGLGGLAICEGMLNGLPVITGKADGTEKDLVDDSNGKVLSDISVKSLYETIVDYVDDPYLVKIKGEESLKKITTTYSFDNYYKSFKNALKYVLK